MPQDRLLPSADDLPISAGRFDVPDGVCEASPRLIGKARLRTARQVFPGVG